MISGIFTGLLALLMALVEIEIEGKWGWAEKTETFYKKSYFSLGKPITGYHMFLFVFFALMFQIPFAFGIPFTFENECNVLSMYFAFVITEDILWILLNPYYGWENRKKIWWHNFNTKLILPIEFWAIIFLSFLAGMYNPFLYFLNLIGIGIIIFISSRWLRKIYSQWYEKMRIKDDREDFRPIKRLEELKKLNESRGENYFRNEEIRRIEKFSDLPPGYRFEDFGR